MKKEELKSSFSLTEVFTGFLILILILSVAFSGIKYCLLLRSETRELKIAEGILQEVLQTIETLGYDRLNPGKSFSQVKNREVSILVTEPDGKNSGLKKVVISLDWTSPTGVIPPEPLILFICK